MQQGIESRKVYSRSGEKWCEHEELVHEAVIPYHSIPKINVKRLNASLQSIMRVEVLKPSQQTGNNYNFAGCIDLS
jgi:hypothetical protein